MMAGRRLDELLNVPGVPTFQAVAASITKVSKGPQQDFLTKAIPVQHLPFD